MPNKETIENPDTKTKSQDQEHNIRKEALGPNTRK